MQTNAFKLIGWLLIAGSVGVFIPYTLLTVVFDYPDILRQDTGVILEKFNAGGPRLIGIWWLFAVLGLPLLGAVVLLGQRYETRSALVRPATTFGVVSLVLQVLGLLRWTFVVPVLARTYAEAADPATQVAVVVVFKAVHQYGGVVLGEHLGQVFILVWTVLMTVVFQKVKVLPRWLIGWSYLASGIYLLAQAELFATVIPGVPVWDAAGLVGSTLWLLWLLLVGIRFVRKPPLPAVSA